jgi:hypothetical protein
MKRDTYLKGIAVYMAFSLLFEIVCPTVAFALTGGPAQPESSSFEPVGTSEMVDLFSGDYNYNIPLLDVGGYPINISYHSGISMDQEASWVGLGWNINPGAINRSMRGLPDDFKGDKIKKEFNVKPNQTYGASVGFGAELFGIDAISVSYSLGAKYNNYTGVGFEKTLNVAITAGQSGKPSGTVGLGLKSSSEGLDVSPSLSFSAVNDKQGAQDTKFGVSLGGSFNSRAGLKALSLNTSIEQGNVDEKSIFRSGSNSVGTGCSYSFANSSYIPSISMPMKNLSICGSYKMGATLFGADGTLNISAYYSEQRLAYNSETVAAYGYMYTEEGTTMDKVMLDFNREKDGAFTKNTPCLPITNHTYDLFSVSGQGVGGMFRPFRGDLGYVFDSRANTTSESFSLGAEIAGGNLSKGGGDVTITDVSSTSGKWTYDNKAIEKIQFRKPTTSNPLYEPCYFKEAGEKNVDTYSALYNEIGNEKPVRVGLADYGAFEVKTKNTLIVGTDGASEIQIPTTPYREARQRRNQLFSFINREEYEKVAIQKNLETSIYEVATSGNNNKNHIAEITTTKTDGTRYVYGLPAYNIVQREVTFNAAGLGDPTEGLISYNLNGTDVDYENGIDHYFSRTTLPPYAHSYLLTAVLSPDYVDITGNGLTPDDYGTYTKFSYNKITNGSGDVYKWRTPYSENKANYNEGLYTGIQDEQGNYVYGEKEMWMLDTIQTKNYIAIFDKKGRADGFDVNGENGRIGNTTTPLLKKISLYSRPDYITNGVSAVPIKVVHFEYDYSLCTGVFNNVAHTDNTSYASGLWTQDSECEGTNQGGKLTLKKIYFTYGNSNKAKLSSYKFSYSSSNPAYGMKDYDRWGNYKDNQESGLVNSEFPYVEQDSVDAATNVSAWTLNKIDLPSGGSINITYESDDYGYVQNRQAMQMFKISSVGHGDYPLTNDPESTIFPHKRLQGDKDYLYFKLQEPVLKSDYLANSSAVNAKFFNDYLSGINDLYFRFFIEINQAGNDFVSGYAKDIISYGVTDYTTETIGGLDYYTYGYIQLQSVTINDNSGGNVNPISKAAVQFARINTPRQAFNYSFDDPDPEHVELADVANSLSDASLIENISRAFAGPNAYLYDEMGFGKDIEPSKSWIRLNNPNKKKLGGGSRVKQISIKDDWGDMLDTNTDTGGENDDNLTNSFSYGQIYDYSTIEDGVRISSGVAAYEPLVGGDENPFRLPVSFSEDLKLVPDLDYFQEEPFGECFFPSAGVGYGKVTVKNLQYAAVNRHATGYVVNEFYTAKDYPVIATRTPMDARPKKTGALLQLLKVKVKDYLTASQGFSIELNDMHGRPKATWVYAENKETHISGVEYKYKSIGNKLDNVAPVINKDGSITNTQIGIDYDFVADMREQQTDVVNAGMQLNISTMIIGVFPIVIPPILPTFSSERTRLRTAGITKVINRFGLLEETIAYDLGSKVSTKNLAYDAETGEILLTKTKNDFNDEMYSINFPAHLAYDRMGPGYKNIGTVLNSDNGLGFNTSTGQITNNPSNILVPGDEVEIRVSSGIEDGRFWVSKESNNNMYIINLAGSHVSVSGFESLKIIRSGRRNQQGLPIASFASLVNPVDKNNDTIFDTQLETFDESFNILNASATEYAENWKTFCECGLDPNEPGNPYVRGILGNWRSKKSYAFLSDRKQTKMNNNSNVRKDGTYKHFKQFWYPTSAPNDSWTAPPDINTSTSDWTWTSEVTEYSPYGPELENKDALNRYSAAIYGYNNTLPIAVGSNTKYKQLANDNFEDYDFDACSDNHFSYATKIDPSGTGVNISTTNSHSGKRSIKVPAGTTVKVNKVLQQCTP